MKDALISYLITDPKYYTNDKEEFEKRLTKNLNMKKVDIACFRDKTSKNSKELAKIFVKICKKFNIKKILINEDFKLAKELDASGVHLTSQQFNKIQESKNLDLHIIISCHNYKEIEEARDAKVNAITYSPIFATPNKGTPKGITKLEESIRVYKDLDIIALGGIISEEHINQISSTNAYGFASIRYFVV